MQYGWGWPRLRLSRSKRAYLPTAGRGIHQTLRRETPGDRFAPGRSQAKRRNKGQTPGLSCLSGSSQRFRWRSLLFHDCGMAELAGIR